MAPVGGTAGEQADIDPDSTGFEATERLQKEFPAESFATEEDLAEVQRVTEGIAPEQMGLALDAVLEGLRGDGVVDCEKLAVDLMIPPEKALEMVQTVVTANSRMITKNLFGGNEELHSDFAKWAIKNHREAYAKASEACARTQSSKPMQKLVSQRIAALKKAEGAKQKREQPKQKPKVEAKAEEPWWERQEREWYERRGLEY